MRPLPPITENMRIAELVDVVAQAARQFDQTPAAEWQLRATIAEALWAAHARGAYVIAKGGES